MMKGLHGKNVLVTGASSGIGQAIAVRFAQEGANVAINYYKEPEGAKKTQMLVEKARCLVDDCRVRTVPIQADVSREDQVAGLFETCFRELGGLDILINNAGILITTEKDAMNSAEEFDWILDVNLRGSYLCAKRFIEHCLQENKPGSITNISSVHEVIPNITCVPYSISKAGMGGLTRTLALKYAARKIRVNGVGPGAIDTPINEDWMSDPEEKKKVEDGIPLGYIGKPEEVASLVVFLASDEASYITGQTYYADGGMMVYPEFREI